MKTSFLSVFAFAVVFAISFLVTDILHENVIKPFNSIVNTTTEKADYNDYRYRISVFDGKLAVFDGNSKIPYKVYDTYIDNLPEDDKKILENGIRVNTSSELMKIIEEYTS